MLVIKNLTKQFKAGKPIFAGISMSFEQGCGVGLVGPNGSGKTTFLRILSVNSFPTDGMVLYNGVDIHRKPSAYLQYVGLVHDEETLPHHLSAMELLEWILRSRKLWEDESFENMNNLFDKLALAERDEPIGTYSTGMKKKTQIAAAIIVEPKILILDEPLRGLDEATRKVVFNLIADTKIKNNTLILMASHSTRSLREISDKMIEFPLTRE
ncbi:MAG: ABC transporter ATP-binding protein [Balneolaceae bacterium]|nr:MAG: ABC transporter ATP-binding protein [Balneolaceae bacterium]